MLNFNGGIFALGAVGAGLLTGISGALRSGDARVACPCARRRRALCPSALKPPASWRAGLRPNDNPEYQTYKLQKARRVTHS